MSISSEITRIQNKRDQSFTEVANKGVTVPAGSTIDDLPGLIAQIEQGSGSGSGGIIYQDLDGYLNLSEDAANVISIVDTLDTAGGTVRTITGAVESGGGGESREDLTTPKDVDFIDFDGRLLYSYTASEFLELTELPPNPSYPGLVAQGWNWTLADAKEFVAEYGAQVIGQNYITDDGKTRIYVTIPENFVGLPDGLNKIYIVKVDNPSVTIDWGDDTSDTSWSGYYASHEYQSAGDYVITIEVTSGTIRLGYQGANQTLVSSNPRAKLCVTKVEIGSGVIGLGRNCFADLDNLVSVSIPTTCISHDAGSDIGWFGGSSLKAVVFAAETVGQDSNVIACANINRHLKYVSIPKTMNGFKWVVATHPRQLRKIIFPNYTTNTTLQLYLYDVPSLTHFIVPGTYTTITPDRCRQSLIKKLIIPETVTSISNTAFAYNAYCEELHLLPTTPPTLANTNAFNNIGGYVTGGCIFYVPYSSDHSILEAYKAATNWSTYASQMQEVTQ